MMASIEEKYKIAKTVDLIKKFEYKVIALQFPDEMLCDSKDVYEILSRSCEFSEFYILGDTTFGSCCVDEVAASHVDADLMIHYGNSCFTKPKKIPCYYVIESKQINLETCLKKFKSEYKNLNDEVVLTSHPHYKEAASHFYKILIEDGYIKVNFLDNFEDFVMPGNDEREQVEHDLMPNSKMFYIGTDTIHLSNIRITNLRSKITWFNPLNDTICEPSSSTCNALQRRYYLIEKAANAKIFGILIGTLGNSSNVKILNYVTRLISIYGRKSYKIAVGKPNPQKLGNFLEVDCFVLLACPESSFLDDRNYYRPVILVYELLLALGHIKTLDMQYIISPADVIRNFDLPLDSVSSQLNPISTNFDSKNNVYILPSSTNIEESLPLVKSNNVNTPIKSHTDQRIHLSKNVDNAAEFLSLRSYKGLEINSEPKLPGDIKEGLSGCAAGYNTEISF